MSSWVLGVAASAAAVLGGGVAVRPKTWDSRNGCGRGPQALGLPPLHGDEEVVPFLGVDQVQDLREGSPRRLHTEGSYPSVDAIFIIEGANFPDGTYLVKQLTECSV